LYIPQNYDRSFKGWVSVRTALGASLNVPAVRALVMVSPEAFAEQLRAVGLPLKNDGDFYGYSLALGSADVSLVSLTNAYRTLANGGRYSPPGFNLSPAPKFTQALSPASSFIVSDILSDNNARARTFGTDSVLSTRFWSAVKTGTSKDMRDNWAMGYSQHYTVGVWVGNASGESMWDVSGVSGAAPVWASVMSFLHAHKRSDPPKPPAGLNAAQVALNSPSGSPIEAARREWFIAGSEVNTINSIALRADLLPASGSKGLKNSPSKITSPAQGTIIALDPDIPPQSQRLQLRAQGDGAGARWLLNGQSLGASKDIAWLPMPGRHTLQLADAQGKVLDEVKFEVRGASLKTASVKTSAVRAK
jgi:penicillin-binding protein 1C